MPKRNFPEANPSRKQILDIGAVLQDGATFQKSLPREFKEFVEQADFLCGHNILAHDLSYLQQYFGDPDWGKDRAIDTLPENQQTAYILNKIEERPYAEVAEIMSLSHAAVESLLFRAKQNLREYLEKYYDRYFT